MFVQNGAPADRLHHMPYGVDADALADEVRSRRPRQRPLTFGFFGSYAQHKGPHVLVEAMASVRGDCRAVLRGRSEDFPDYSGPLRERAASRGDSAPVCCAFPG